MMIILKQKQESVITDTKSLFREIVVSEQPFESEIDFEKSVFLKKKPELLQNPDFIGKYVAVIKGEIIDKDDDKHVLLKRVYEKQGYVPILIEKISEEELEYTTSPNFEYEH